MANLQNRIFDKITYYNTYFKKKRSERQIYIMLKAMERVCGTWFPNAEPNLYVMYLTADASLSIIKSKSEQYMISELEMELIKDMHIFNKLL